MKAIIFDMDGVLVDVSNSYRTAIKKTVGFFTGKEPTDKKIDRMKNKGGYNNDWDLTEALIEQNIPKKKIITKFQDYYKGKDFDGLIQNEKWLLKKETLDSLKGYSFGIVTGRPRDEAEFALKRSGMGEYFSVMIAMEDMDEEKPNPLLLRIALKQLECTEGYYLGDNVDDMKMACNAGVTGIGVGSAKDMLLENGAVAVIDDVNKLTEVVS